MNSYLTQIKSVFESNQNTENSVSMENYMKNKFYFLGIKSPKRKALEKLFLSKEQLPELKKLPETIRVLWQEDAREYQYFAIELLKKYMRKADASFLQLYEEMITHKSWWDTVDLIASTLVGDFLQRFPKFLPNQTDKWINSENIWLQRTAILFQLKYREQTDFELLKRYVQQTADSKEFFIQKAIGWALREYSKREPQAVRDFIQNQPLSKLSLREGSKYL